MLPVIYRTWKDHGDVMALFPTIPESNYCVMSYQHVGQHGGADYTGCIAMTRPATEEEYTPLHQELISIGYDDLKIYKRKPN